MSSSVRRSQTLPYALLSKIPMPSCPTGKAKKKAGKDQPTTTDAVNEFRFWFRFISG